MVVASGLDEGDRPSEAGTLISTYRLGEGINVDGADVPSSVTPFSAVVVTQLGGELLQQSAGSVGDDGSGREDGSSAGLVEFVEVTGRNDAADDDHDVGTTGRSQSLPQRRHQGEVTGCQRRHTDYVDVVVGRLIGDLFGGLEQRSDVDVESDVREGRGDDLLATVVTVLAHLRDEDAGTTSLVLGELLDQFHRLADVAHRSCLVAVHTTDGADLGLVASVHLFEGVGKSRRR